jgi:hypothetical protein
MSKTVTVRKFGQQYSFTIPTEFKKIFEGSDHAVVEQIGNSLIYRPAEIKTKEETAN